MTHRNATILAIAGGALMAIGSFMPWLEARTGLGSISVPGTAGDGVATLVGGVIVGLLALVHLDRPVSKLVRGAVVLVGLLGLVIFAIDFSAAQVRIESIDDTAINASVGAGLYLVGIGAVASIVGGLSMSSRLAAAPPTPLAEPGQGAALQTGWGPTTQAAPGMHCGRCGKALSPVWKGKCEHCGATYAMYMPVARSEAPSS